MFAKSNALYERYCQEAKKYPNVIFGGRLGGYRYYDMDKVIRQALDLAKTELETAEKPSLVYT